MIHYTDDFGQEWDISVEAKRQPGSATDQSSFACEIVYRDPETGKVWHRELHRHFLSPLPASPDKGPEIRDEFRDHLHQHDLCPYVRDDVESMDDVTLHTLKALTATKERGLSKAQAARNFRLEDIQ